MFPTTFNKCLASVVCVVAFVLIGVQGHEFQPDDAKLILKQHNEYRRQESAADMYQMFWNVSLQQRADNWARRCLFKHERSPDVGENLFFDTDHQNGVYSRGLKAWYDEKTNWGYTDQGCRGTCHYTQVVWSYTTNVGCSAHVCPNLNVGGRMIKNAMYLVCFYYPRGNFVGHFPYAKGQACSDCAEGDTCLDGLCVSSGPESKLAPDFVKAMPSQSLTMSSSHISTLDAFKSLSQQFPTHTVHHSSRHQRHEQQHHQSETVVSPSGYTHQSHSRYHHQEVRHSQTHYQSRNDMERKWLEKMKQEEQGETRVPVQEVDDEGEERRRQEERRRHNEMLKKRENDARQIKLLLREKLRLEEEKRRQEMARVEEEKREEMLRVREQRREEMKRREERKREETQRLEDQKREEMLKMEEEKRRLSEQTTPLQVDTLRLENKDTSGRQPKIVYPEQETPLSEKSVSVVTRTESNSSSWNHTLLTPDGPRSRHYSDHVHRSGVSAQEMVKSYRPPTDQRGGSQQEEEKQVLDADGRPCTDRRKECPTWATKCQRSAVVTLACPLTCGKCGLHLTNRKRNSYSRAQGNVDAKAYHRTHTRARRPKKTRQNQKKKIEKQREREALVREKDQSLRGSDAPVRERDQSLRGSDAPVRGKEQSLRGSDAPVRGKEQSLRGSDAPVRERDQSLGGSDAPVRGSDAPQEMRELRMRQVTNGVQRDQETKPDEAPVIVEPLRPRRINPHTQARASMCRDYPTHVTSCKFWSKRGYCLHNQIVREVYCRHSCASCG
ncbi:trichohyalin-like [Physella acuta]|uniref:trichohyalin-like n=1 Tax=Physella acuta TaxID=109671 RepID=UPI0027DD35C4|nr:trichohyalin-like [Physella acuta]XP_059147633.1 trichohyalin-like [Physella acuta]